MKSIFVDKKIVRDFAPWYGCSKDSSGCKACVAHRWAESPCEYFSGQVPRPLRPSNTWRKPLTWNRAALTNGTDLIVVGASSCDWADEEAPEGQRKRLWELIRETTNLKWNLITKRASNIEHFLPDDWPPASE